MSYLSIFRLEFQKTIVIFEICTLEFVINQSLTHTVNFVIWSAFSKGPWSTFSEGPGPLYKVCRNKIFITKITVSINLISFVTKFSY